MGCNCGGGGGKTIGAQASQRRAGRSSTPLGFSQDAPLLLGDENDVILRVRAVVPTAGLGRGQAAWVTGSGVQEHLDSGDLLDITHRAQKKRMWSVGAFTYTSWQEAVRVAAAQGTTPIEVA